MKSFGKLVCTVLSVVLILCLSCVNVAAQTDYTYTITFYAGTQGEFDSTDGLYVDGAAANVSQSADKIVITGLSAGDEVSFTSQSAIKLDADSKHYVQGVRLSGHDNNTVSASVFKVDSDRDYVVAYGIKGNMASYTIHYQDADGNALLEDDVFYGNVGDKPVVAYKYVEGYEPRVLGFTKTLSENEAENVFTFLYDKIPETVVIIPGQNPGDNQGETSTPENPENPENPQGPTGEDTPSTNPDDENPQGGSEDNPIVDLDDEDVPLANPDADENSKGFPMAGMIAIAAIALVGIANAIFLIKKRRTANK